MLKQVSGFDISKVVGFTKKRFENEGKEGKELKEVKEDQ